MGFEHANVVDQIARVHRQGRDVSRRCQRVDDSVDPIVGRHLDEDIGAVEGLGQLDKRGKVMQAMCLHTLGLHGCNHSVPLGVAPIRRPKPKRIQSNRRQKRHHACDARFDGQAALWHIPHNGHALSGVGGLVQCAQGHFERPQIVVAVVLNEDATARPLDGGKPSRGFGQQGEFVLDVLEGGPVMQRHQGGRARVVHGGVACERQGHGGGGALPVQVQVTLRGVHLDLKGSMFGTGLLGMGPGDRVLREVGRASEAQRFGQKHPGTGFEEGAFLAHQVIRPFEVAEVCLSQMRQHPFRRDNAIAQPFHFAWVADSGFDQGQVVVLFQGPHAQRHAELAVVAEWAAVNREALRQEGGDPLLDRGFAVASGDGQNRTPERVTLCSCRMLQGRHHVGDHQDVAVLGPRVRFSRRLADHPATDARGVGFGEVVVTVVPGSDKREENRCCGMGQGARVRAQVPEQPFFGSMMGDVAVVGRREGLAPRTPRMHRPPSTGHSTAVWFAAT